MLQSETQASYYFSQLSFSDLFAGNTYVWDVLPKIRLLPPKNSSIIDPSASIHPTAIIKNSIILENTFVGEFVTIRDSLISSNCIIGHCSEVARSLIMEKSAITHFCFVGDSVIGNSVLFGGGVRTANRRLDKNAIQIRIQDDCFLTNTNSIGAIIGDGCRLGGGSHTNPGTLIGKQTFVMPGIEVWNFIPSNSYVHVRKSFEITKNRIER